jgi:hypothetical protein
MARRGLASYDASLGGIGKNLRATARFLSVYGRLPTEFTPETAMGLMANIPSIEASEALTLARGIAVALGDSKMFASCVYQTTGSDQLAQRVEIQAQMQKGSR